MEPIIKLNNVSLSIGQKKILNSINLEIYKGEVFGIVGPSGHGKSTLLRIIIGFLKPTQGTIRVESDDRQLFGFATQDNSFYPELTVQENIRYFGKIYNLNDSEIEKNMESMLKIVQLENHKNTLSKNLSGGMQRRLDIVCAMIHNPKILILDEPTTGLDPMLRKDMWHLITTLNSIGTTIILSSHMLDEVELLCSRVAILKNGTTRYSFSISDLKYMSPTQEIHLILFPGQYEPLAEHLKSNNIISHYRIEKGEAYLYTQDASTAIYWVLYAAKEMNERVLDLDINQMSLQQIFEEVQK